MLRRFLYKLEYKKVKEEFEELECFFENQFERYAALGNEDNKEEIKKNEKLTKRFNYLYKRYEELEEKLSL